MALKKPLEYFKRKDNISSIDDGIQELEKTPELNTFSDAFQSFKDNLSKIEVLSDFSETLDNYRINIERVNHLSESIEDIRTEIQNHLKKDDLDRAMMSQLIVVEESIRDVQNKVKSINEKNLTEIRLDVSGLTKNVNQFLEVEVPRYKKLIVDSEFRTFGRYEELEENVNQTLDSIGEYVEEKYEELIETLEGINEKSLSSILEDFKLLENNLEKIKQEDIPRYKGFIVETERKSESKINEFEKKLDEVVLNIEEKISLIQDDKTDIINQVTEKIEDINILNDQVSNELDTNKIYKEELDKKISDLKVEIVRNETHIKVQNKNLESIQENVRNTLKKINLQGIEEQNHKLSEKIKYLEEVFEKFNERDLLSESIVVEPATTNNQDPLTPLDKNFVTLDQLQEHYRLFINRIQQQLATIGGGGETRLEFLDDVDRTSAKQDGYVLQYSESAGKFIGTSYVPGGGGGDSIVSISGVPPDNPIPGKLWYDDTLGRTFIYYQDDDGTQWVDASPSGVFPINTNWNYSDTSTTTLTSVGIGTTTFFSPSNKLEVIGGDIKVGINTSTGIVLTSPNGTQFRLIVGDDGSLSTSSV